MSISVVLHDSSQNLGDQRVSLLLLVARDLISLLHIVIFVLQLVAKVIDTQCRHVKLKVAGHRLRLLASELGLNFQVLPWLETIEHI